MPELSLPVAVLLFPGGLFALALGLALKGVDRRVVARLQRRVGPPLAQPLFDLVKLARKDTLVPAAAPRRLFLGAPLAGAVAMALAAALIPIAGLYTPAPVLGDLLVLLYLLTVPAIVLMLAGSSSASPFGALGFSREMALVLAYEGPLLLLVAAVAVFVGRAEGQLATFSLADIVAWQQANGPLAAEPLLWPALLAFLAFYPANLGIVPFDIPEAETEVLEGPLVEYSGPALGLFKVMSALKAVVVLGLGIALFFPLAPEAGWAALAAHLGKYLVLTVLGVSLVRTAMGRMRIDQAFRFFLRGPLALAFTSLALVLALA
ncbi:MAG: NADH-quinone oxidoreductase subunit H [Magnetospirillum sp.]|nr:NADH-quinone oxidoreductase subunit H [Magnetospirillum sp.]